MSVATTTLKLPELLKSRIAHAAEYAGPPHAYMLEALQAQTELAERRRELVDAAIQAREEAAQYGLVYDADEVFSYIQAVLEGKQAERPAPTKL